MKEKALWAVNLVLVLTAVLLTLHFFEVTLPTVGYAEYWLDPREPLCLSSFKGQTSLLDLDRCCLGLQAQLKCENQKEKLLVGGKEINVYKRCSTGPSAIEYLANKKAYNYCLKEGYLS